MVLLRTAPRINEGLQKYDATIYRQSFYREFVHTDLTLTSTFTKNSVVFKRAAKIRLYTFPAKAFLKKNVKDQWNAGQTGITDGRLFFV